MRFIQKTTLCLAAVAALLSLAPAHADSNPTLRCKCTWTTGWDGEGSGTFSPQPGEKDCKKTEGLLNDGNYPGGSDDPDAHDFECTPIRASDVSGVSNINISTRANSIEQ